MKALSYYKFLQDRRFTTLAYVCLIELVQAGHQSLRSLANELNMSEASALSLIDRLVILHYLERKMPEHGDRRCRVTIVTEKGLTLLKDFHDLQTRTDTE